MTPNSQSETEQRTDQAPAGQVGEESQAQRKALLRERAQMLAREPAAQESGERLEVVEFLLGHERYGIETSFVREVHPLRDMTPLPCTPSFVLGIINLRGKILSVVDIRKFFDLEPQGPVELNKVIVLRCATMEFGILADSVLGVRSIAAGGLQASLTTITGIRADYLKGVTAEHLVLLDAGKMLTDRRMVVHEEV